MDPQVLINAADVIEKLASAFAEGQQDLAKVAADAKTYKAQAEEVREQVKQAADARAEVAGLAKTAAAAVYDAGLVRSTEARDELAVQLLDHDAALDQLSKIASLVEAPKSGVVVTGGSAKVASADDVWEGHIRQLSY